VNAFDPKTGADFLYKQTVVANFPNYDQSKFSSSKPLAAGNDAKIQEILSRCFDINEEIAPDKFKSYEELKKKFLWVTGAEQKAAARKEYDSELDELAKIANEKPVKPAAAAKSPPIATAVASDDDDDAFFRSLVEE
jgi:gp32 DNA binding protein like